MNDNGLPPGGKFRAGVYDLLEPIRLSGRQAALSGELQNGRPATLLTRGRKADGALYTGPLILIENAQGASVTDIEINGARFRQVGDVQQDERHPLTRDRASPLFLCGRQLAPPDCYDPRNFTSQFEADVILRNSQDVELKSVVCRDPVRIGIAIAAGSTGIRLNRCSVDQAGDYGVWIGTGIDPADHRLPLDQAYLSRMPRNVSIDDCLIERCGAAGVYIEGRNIQLARTQFLANLCDAPYNDEGGQLTIDYKANRVRVIKCIIVGGPCVVRLQPDGSQKVLGVFGVEGCGSDLRFEDTVIEGNSREGVQLLGARNVRFLGRTRIFNNHLAQHRYPSGADNKQRQNISVSTLAAFAAVNAVAEDISLDGIVCENGLAVWCDGGVPDLKLNRLQVRGCDLSGPDHSGVAVFHGPNGQSPEGTDWCIENQLE
jgi:hypothetical protein